MTRARTQRILAAAGLSVVTGTAAIGLAIVGVGPLGQVAASVRDTGVAVSRGVLSVVMPDDDPPPATDAGGGDSSAAPAPRRDAEERDAGETPVSPVEPDDSEDAAPAEPGLPDAAAAAGKPEPTSVLEAMAEAFGSPDAQASADAAGDEEPTGLVDGLLGGVLGSANDLTWGALR